MSYLPLARKYRPQTFDELIGQPHVSSTLTRALEAKRAAQAYLFAGLRGVGKTSAARILAKCLNCANGPTATPCNRCSSCAQITAGISLDVIEIDGASNRGIDEIRSLRETVPFAPTSGQFRVYIIDEVHMLTTEAFNALLKTLEEPPAHVKFIFATTAANKVPATILSRCQRFDFRRLDSSTIVTALARIAQAETIRVDEPALYAIARASDGSLRDAEVVLEQLVSFAGGPISEADVTALVGSMESEALIALTRAIFDRDCPAALEVLTGQVEQGKDAAQILTGLLRHLRNLLIIRTIEQEASRSEVVGRLVDEPSDRLKRLEEQAGHATPHELLMFLQILTGAYEMVRRSPMAQTILELVVIKLATREHWQSLEAISRRLEQLSAGATTPGAATKPVGAAPPERPPVAAAASASEMAPEAAAVGQGSTAEELSALWPTFLERLGKRKMSLAAYLMDAKPLRRDQETMTVGLPGFSLHHEVLALADNRRLIDQLLSELCNTRITVQYATLPAAGEPSPAPGTTAVSAARPPIVQDIVNLFNATVLNNPPHPAS